VILKYDRRPTVDHVRPADAGQRGRRYISLLERDGKMQVVIPYSATSNVAVSDFRSEGRSGGAEEPNWAVGRVS